MSRTRGFVHILVVLVVLAGIASGIYFVQQKTQLFSQANSKNTAGSQDIIKTTFNPDKSISTIPSQQSAGNPFTSIFDRLKTRGGTAQTQNNPTSAPSPTPIKTGGIRGKVVGGYYSTPLSQASIKAVGQGIEKTTATDTSGDFTLTGLPVGSYNLSFSHPDYNITDWNNFEVKEGENNLPRTPNGFLKIFKPTTVQGTVFVDHNNNNQKDSGDEGLNWAILTLQNKIGSDGWGNYKSISTDQSGSFSVTIPDGSVYKIVPGGYTYYNKPNPSSEFVVDGYGGTKEFSFAYYPTTSQAGLEIVVFNDKNENSIKNADEENIDYYYAEVTNTSTGSSFKTGVSANSSSGKGEQVLDYGTYIVKLVPGDSSWASYYKITLGESSFSVTSSSGKQTVKLGVHKLF